MTDSSMAEVPPPLPASEQALLQSLLALRFRKRVVYTQSLALAHGESLLPLIQVLLATQPAIRSIPIPRPPKKESDLNADGGNPEPEIDDYVLQFPQTNASSRYIQRNAGLTMAINLAQKGSQAAISVLLAELNHPSQSGKKGIIQCLAAHANDQDILAASVDSAPSVRDSLVASLTENKRKDLVCDILGKPRPVSLHLAIGEADFLDEALLLITQDGGSFWLPRFQKPKNLYQSLPDSGARWSKPRSMTANAYGTTFLPASMS